MLEMYARDTEVYDVKKGKRKQYPMVSLNTKTSFHVAISYEGSGETYQC